MLWSSTPSRIIEKIRIQQGNFNRHQPPLHDILKWPMLIPLDDAPARLVGNEIGVIRVVVRKCVVMSYGAEATYMNFNSQLQIHEKTQKGLLDTKTQ